MRTARIKPAIGTYYHICNRVAGEAGWFPFGDIERQKLVELIVKFSRLFTVELIAYEAMSNHYHAICYAPAECLPVPDAVAHYNAFYEGTKPLVDPESHEAAALPEKLRNVSEYARLVQQSFSVWFNRTRSKPRRGGLWADRFKSTIVGTGESFLKCLCYIEMNCVRAGLVVDPAEYRFGSWGAWAGTGRHPFAANFFRHMHLCQGLPCQDWTDDDIRDFLRTEMARRHADDDPNATPETIAAVVTEAHKPVGLLMTAERRCRYWTDGLIIGSKTFVLETAAAVRSRADLARHRLLVLRTPQNARLYAYRRVRDAVT